jgi:hypothetical protein
MGDVFYGTIAGSHWGSLSSKAQTTQIKIGNGFFVPKTWDSIVAKEEAPTDDIGIAISAMLTQFLFAPDEITLYEHTNASLDSDWRQTENWVIFDDESRIQLEVKSKEINRYPGYLIRIKM